MVDCRREFVRKGRDIDLSTDMIRGGTEKPLELGRASADGAQFGSVGVSTGNIGDVDSSTPTKSQDCVRAADAHPGAASPGSALHSTEKLLFGPRGHTKGTRSCCVFFTCRQWTAQALRAIEVGAVVLWDAVS